MKRIASEKGSSLVEFAIASSILFVMLFGILEFSFAFYSYNFTAEAAKETARYLSVRGSNSCVSNSSLANCNYTSNDVSAIVQGLNYPGITSIATCSANAGACASWPDGDNNPGHNVKVVVNYSFPLSIPFLSATQLNLKSTAEMVISN